MKANVLDRLLQPATVAIVGASADPRKTTGRPLRYLRKHGFAGRILPVNPKYPMLDGLECFPSIAALPVTPDAAIVLLDPAQAEDAVRQLAQRGTGAAIVLAGGYCETGEEGAERQRRLREAAGSMRLLGPNTIGLINVAGKVMLSASGSLEVDVLQQGGVALISQSGGVLGSLLSRAAYRGVGFSALVATGNEADLDMADFIEYFAADPATSVIALYMEGLRDVDAFRAAAFKAAKAEKPIVVFKIGRSEAGARSASSHTGALAGSDEIYDALFKQVGAIRLTTFADLLDVPATLASKRRLNGRNLAVLTSTGGAAALITDACGMVGFSMPRPDAITIARLGTLMVGDGAVPDRNPIDLTLAGLKHDIFKSAIATLLESPTYDGVVVVVGSSGIDQPDLVAKPVLENLALGGDKPVVVYVSPSAPAIIRNLTQQGVPTFDAPESCAAALAAIIRSPVRLTRVPAATAAKSAFDLDGLRAGPLDETEAKVLFARFGIPAVREFAAASPNEAAKYARQLGGPVVLKVLSREIAHKSDLGGVLIGVAPSEVAARCIEMRELVTRNSTHQLEGFLVQELVEDGVEMILGTIRDPQLGPTILLGAGGIATEIFGDTALRLPPLDRADAVEMLAKSSQPTYSRGIPRWQAVRYRRPDQFGIGFLAYDCHPRRPPDRSRDQPPLRLARRKRCEGGRWPRQTCLSS